MNIANTKRHFPDQIKDLSSFELNVLFDALQVVVELDECGYITHNVETEYHIPEICSPCKLFDKLYAIKMNVVKEEKEEDHTGHEKDMCDDCTNISYCIEDECMFCIDCYGREGGQDTISNNELIAIPFPEDPKNGECEYCNKRAKYWNKNSGLFTCEDHAEKEDN